MKTTRFLMAAGISLAIAFNYSCSSGDNDGDSSSSYVEKGNDIEKYSIVKIGDQTWMAENLDYAVEGSKCYDNDPANCVKYGRLYDWATAMALPSSCNSSSCSSLIESKHRGVCPLGWHIPSNAEWDALYSYADGTYVPDYDNSSGYSSTAGGKLKSSEDGGTDDFGFAALLGGQGDPDDVFGQVGSYGDWWSASESKYGRYNAYYWYMGYHSDGAYWGSWGKSPLFSIRCVQD